MAKRRVNVDTVEQPIEKPRVKSTMNGSPQIPTGSARHMPRIRYGRFDPSVFARRNRVEKRLDLGGGKVTDNASQEQEAAAVGVRREGRRVGTKAPLQSPEPKAKEAQGKEVTKGRPQRPKNRKHKSGQRQRD